MKNTFTRWVSASLFIVLGLLIAIGPQTFFKPCQGLLQLYEDGAASDRYVPMKCHWSAVAEIGAGGAIALLGLFLLFFAASQVRFGLSLAQLVLGLLSFLITTKLIGTCMSKTMECNLVMLPMLLVLSSLTIVVSLINVLLLFRDARGKV